MIFTVTTNPSLDYIIAVDTFEMGRTNRTVSEDFEVGGKGINVSRVLKNLGMDSQALGFISGFTGEEIKRRLCEYGINNDFYDVHNSCSRINIKFKSSDGTEINAAGPKIGDDAQQWLSDKLKCIKKDDILVLAGSPPKSHDMLYAEIMKEIAGTGAHVIVDATSASLENTLEYKPFLVKPNLHELEDLFGVSIHSTKEVFDYADRLKKMGAVNVIVSMGADGAVMIDEYGRRYTAKAPKGQVVSSVGAGDSMVAGFIKAVSEQLSYEEVFRYAVATGSATAFSEGMAGKELVGLLYQRVELE